MQGLLAELKRRHVFRALIAWGVFSFAVLQIIEPIMHGLRWPESVLSYVVAALAAGFPVVVGLAWMLSGEEPTSQAPRGLRLGLLILALGAIAAAPGLFWYFVRGARQEESPPPQPTAQSAPARPGTASIAVLPFVNLSADKDNEYFSDGLSETLLDMLAQVPALSVAARTSSFAFKGKADDIRKIGAALGVQNLLEGSVQKSGGRIRVTAQLVRAQDGSHLWSHRFDRDLADVFKVQDEIAGEVVQALRVALLDADRARLTQKRTDSFEAYQEYLQGNALLPERKVEQLRRAVTHFERAIALDPGYAQAYVGASDALLMLIWYGDATDEQRARSKRYAERALELAPNLGEAHASLAEHLYSADDNAGAQRELQRAVELAPSDATVHHWYSEALLEPPARTEESLMHAERAAALDPLSPVIQGNLSHSQLAAGKEAEARSTIERLVRDHPDYASGWIEQARFAVHDGDLRTALRAMREHDRADPEGLVEAVKRCFMLMRFGALEPARACVAGFAAKAPQNRSVIAEQANLLSAAGDSKAALALLERSPGGNGIARAVVLLRLGRAAEALAIFRPLVPALMVEPVPALSLADAEPASLAGLMLIRTGSIEHGRALLKRAIEAMSKPGPLIFDSTPWDLAIGYEFLGERDKAIAALERVVGEGTFVDFSFVDTDPLTATLRTDRRYPRIAERPRALAAEQVRLAREAGLL
jgi:TolB-like protein/predicted Zn-dependent protease